MNDLLTNFNLEESALGHLTSAVQFGFIFGTMIYALLNIADRFSPSKVFFISALIAALFNLGMIYEGNNLYSLVMLRFMTGFFLAGIYPVGMKIAADYFQKGLGLSLSFLVGALVLGTGFPHFLNSIKGSIPWQKLIVTTSTLASAGGIFLFLFVPNGPYRKPALKINLAAFFTVFQKAEFRSASFGYFGHMWELYAFWAFVPIMLRTFSHAHPELLLNIPLWSFIVIAAGSLGCLIGGKLSQKIGPKKVAILALSISGSCCLLSPLLFSFSSTPLFLIVILIWGMAVIADSPLLSTLVAQNVEASKKGTALTIVNSIGFGITILSIQLLSYLNLIMNPKYIYLFLVIGPIIGLFKLYDKGNEHS